MSTRVFDEISYACDGQSVVLTVNNGNVSTTNPSGMAAAITSSEHGGRLMECFVHSLGNKWSFKSYTKW